MGNGILCKIIETVAPVVNGVCFEIGYALDKISGKNTSPSTSSEDVADETK